MYGGGKNQSEESIIKSIRNLCKLKKGNEAIKDRISQNKEVITNQ